jgi:hypothetical protein
MRRPPGRDGLKPSTDCSPDFVARRVRVLPRRASAATSEES